MSFINWVREYRSLTFAYALLVLLIVGGFFRVEMLSQEVNLESKRTANLLCEQSNNTLDLIIEILEVTDPHLVNDFRADLQPVECPPNPDKVLID